MKLRKLPVITEEQYEKLRGKGLEIGKKTTVESVLKFFREDQDAVAFDSRAPFFVKIHVMKCYMSEVMWFDRKPYYGADAKIMGLYKTWDQAMSAALDYILGIKSIE
jgi:hypothetical protein